MEMLLLARNQAEINSHIKTVNIYKQNTGLNFVLVLNRAAIYNDFNL